MDSLGDIDDHVGSSVVRSEAPDFGGIFFFPSELFSESLSSDFDILSGSDFVVFNEERQVFVKRGTGSVDSVVFVLGFGHSRLS